MKYSKSKCQCGVVHRGDIYTHEIKYCPLHKAAPKLLEALRELLQGNEVYRTNKETGYRVVPSPDKIKKGMNAIALAEGIRNYCKAYEAAEDDTSTSYHPQAVVRVNDYDEPPCPLIKLINPEVEER